LPSPSPLPHPAQITARNTGFGACSVGDGRLRRAGRARRRKPQRSPSQLLLRSRARISLTGSAAPLPRLVAALLLPQAAVRRPRL